MSQRIGGESTAAHLRVVAAERLERVRRECGYERLADLHEELVEADGYSVGYSTVASYHNEESGREPPASYFVRVAEVTGARLEWLMRGEGPMFADEVRDVEHPELPDRTRKGLDAFWEELPFEQFRTGMVDTALTNLIVMCGRASQELDEDDYRRFGKDVHQLLVFPYKKLGFSGMPNGRSYSQYVFSVVNALLPVMPERGLGWSSYPFQVEVPKADES